jgi:hypothetical protein
VTLDAIRLNPNFRPEEHRVVLRYLTDERALSLGDWVLLREAVETLGTSVVVLDHQETTFRRFYEEQIDPQFADPFLAHLLGVGEVEMEGRREQAATARAIGQMLASLEGFRREDVNCRMLLVYCLYWWAAFARGYSFEIAILRDLEASGIAFVAHDIGSRAERTTPYDLILLDLRGDIKYSTYFLTAERLAHLTSDFFITRWYLPRVRQWLRAVLLRGKACQTLGLPHDDSGATMVTLEDVETILPEAATFIIDHTVLTATGYEPWKERVQKIQSAKRE